MSLAIPCERCGRIFKIAEQLRGRKIRCQSCGQVQRIPVLCAVPADQQPAVYSVIAESPNVTTIPVSQSGNSAQKPRLTTARNNRTGKGHGVLRWSIGEASLLELESLGLIALSRLIFW